MPMIVVESRRFDVAKRLSGREALVRELLDFKVEVTKRGNACLRTAVCGPFEPS